MTAVLLAICLQCRLWGADPGQGLVGHWRLESDCRDSSGRGNHGVAHGVRFDSPQGAEFNGIDAYVEVPHSDSLGFGTKDFSMALWLHTEAEPDDALGDILSKYDPASRTGINFTLMSYTGVTSSQSNWRNLLFGIDSARIDCEWTDCGRPGKSRNLCSLAVFDGGLYAGTLETGQDEAGHVFRYDGETCWTDCGSPDRCNSVFALAVHDGHLHAGVSRRDTTHDGQVPSANQNPGGKVYRYEGGTKWTDCGRLGQADSVYAMAVFGGKLYATPLYWASKGLYRYEGGMKWTFCGHPGQRVEPLTVFNGHLYAASFDGGEFFRYNGPNQWTRLPAIPDTTQTYSIGIYQGRMHVGTWPNGLVYRYDEPTTWTLCGRLGSEQEIQGMLVYNGHLLAGTLPLAKVYRYAGDQVWNYTGHLDTTPQGLYRRAWSMAVYGGRLYVGTLPSGHLWTLEAGKCVTYDRELAAGWRHVAAVKSGGAISLYVDGRCVATSTSFDPSHYELSNNAPLRIGFGQHDYFKGRLRDLRIYDRKLDENEIRALLQSDSRSRQGDQERGAGRKRGRS